MKNSEKFNYFLFSFFLLLTLSACGSDSVSENSQETCYSNTSSIDLKNDDFYIYTRTTTEDDGLSVSVEVTLGEFPISKGNPRNDIDLRNGESIELIVDGKSYALGVTSAFGPALIPSPCIQGVLNYEASFTLDQKIPSAAQLRVNRNTENDIVSDFELPVLLEIIEPTVVIETYNPTTDSLFFSWINRSNEDLKFELKDSLFCYEIQEEIPAGTQQYSLLAGTNLDRLAPSCESETQVSLRLISYGTELDVSTNLPDGHTLFTNDINLLINIAEKLVY